MTARLTVGRGYRRLKPGERLRKGDEFFHSHNSMWLVTGFRRGSKQQPRLIYRRRQPKKTTQ